jgi:2-dehydropantoate 2-reductase
VSLIFHTSNHYRSWQDSQKEIVIRTEGIPVARGGFDAELVPAGFRKHGKVITKDEYNDADLEPDSLRTHERMALRSDEDVEDPGLYIPEGSTRDEPIHNLIVSVKAGVTVPALLGVRHRLGPDSAILFLQNGLGQIDEVNEEVFPDPETRPSYLSGVISHGVHSHSNMEATHAGFGTIAIGVPPSKPSPKAQTELPSITLDATSPSSRYLLRTICRSPVLAAVPNSPTELFQAQLEKLAANAIINPITALMDARNGALTYNFALTRAMRLLLGEISLVIRSLPELSSLPNVNTRFAPDRLETLVVSIAHRTRNNISSMLADTRKGNLTEIQYINGYVVKRGEELGITCYMNYLIAQLVRGKQQLISLERQDELPFAGTPRSGGA